MKLLECEDCGEYTHLTDMSSVCPEYCPFCGSEEVSVEDIKVDED